MFEESAVKKSGILKHHKCFKINSFASYKAFYINESHKKIQRNNMHWSSGNKLGKATSTSLISKYVQNTLKDPTSAKKGGSPNGCCLFQSNLSIFCNRGESCGIVAC